jgi:hypothetical protein
MHRSVRSTSFREIFMGIDEASWIVILAIILEIGQLGAVLLAVALFRIAGRLWPPFERSRTPAVVVSAALLAVGSAWFMTRTVTFGN